MNFVTTLLLCFGFGPEASGASQMALAVKNPLANAGDWVSIPGWGRSPGGGDDNPLQYSCLENPLDRGAYRATVRRITKRWRTTEAT